MQLLSLRESKVHGSVYFEREESGGEGVCPGPSPPTAGFKVPPRGLLNPFIQLAY